MSTYRPYSSPTGLSNNGGSSAMQGTYPTTSLLGSLASRLPYAFALIGQMIDNNPKFYKFKNEASLKDDMLQDSSVLLSQNNGQDNYGVGAPGSFAINKDYQAFVYATLDKDKGRRLQDYRQMAAYAELADALDEICDECLVIDEDGNIINIRLKGDYSKTIQDTISTEFRSFIEIYDLENTGWEKFRQLLVEGETFYENIIKEGKEDLGILGLISIPPELINPVYHNVQNELLKGFLLQKPIIGPTQSMNSEDQTQLMFLQKAQVSYIHSGMWNQYKTIRLPFIENAKRAYRQLSLIEDAVVIYRLVRAPERLVFKVHTGNRPAPQAEAYLKGLMMKFWSKKTFNSANGQVANVYDPQSMLDAYWFPVDNQGKGTSVETLPSGGALGEIKDLNYFLTKLYNALKVPASRFLQEGVVFSDGKEITRDELRFARFIMRLQAQFALGIKQTFITHLKLKGLWKDYNLRDNSIKIRFNEPTSFMAMRNQELLALKFENYNTATQSEAMSKSYAQKYYLNMTAEHMKENREWLRKDAALSWELAQITTSGPNFREAVAAQQNAGAAQATGGGGGAPSGAGEIPDFGSAETPGTEGEAPTETPPGAEGTPGTAPEAGTEMPPV